MLEEMIKAVIDKVIDTKYPHLKQPSILLAKATLVNGGPESAWNEYRLTVLDRFGAIDERYPVLPGVQSVKLFEPGVIVAVALPYGDLTPVIIGEVRT